MTPKQIEELNELLVEHIGQTLLAFANSMYAVGSPKSEINLMLGERVRELEHNRNQVIALVHKIVEVTPRTSM